MADRYRGRYSPDPANPSAPTTRRTPSAAEGRTRWLFVFSLIFAAKAFFHGPADMLRYLAVFAILLLATWLTREGVRAKAAYDARRSARKPAFPRKIFGSILTGIGLGLAAASTGAALVTPVLIGLAGAALHFATFGADPMKNKGMEGIDTFQQDRVARVVDEAETYLSAMTDAIKRAGDRQAESRVERFLQSVRELIRTVEEDPRDLVAARKFLGVYLMGARDATVKFADIYSRTRDASARSDYMMLLTDLEESFGQKTKKLLLDNNTDLTVEIEVLRDRLQREGVRLD